MKRIYLLLIFLLAISANAQPNLTYSTKSSAASIPANDVPVTGALSVYDSGGVPSLVSQYSPMPTLPLVSFDAGGRIRVGQLETLIQLSQLNAIDSLLVDTTGNGTASYANSVYTLSAAAGQYQIASTHHRAPYFPGKSQQVEVTFYNFAPTGNGTSSVGYFDTSTTAPYTANPDGFWLQSDGGGNITLNMSRAGTSVLSVAQANWNGSPGPRTHNFDNFSIVMWDFLWLGGARLRMFVKTTNGFELAHTFEYGGSAPAIFMQSPNHRIRFEARNGADIVAVCAQVSTEGQIFGVGKERALDSVSTVTCANTTSSYPLIAIRGGPGFLDRALKLLGYSAYISSSNDSAVVRLLLNPTITGNLTAFATVTNSAAQVAYGNGTQTISADGTVLYTTFLSTSVANAPNILERDFLSSLGSTLSGASDVIVVSLQPITAGVDARAAVIIREF